MTAVNLRWTMFIAILWTVAGTFSYDIFIPCLPDIMLDMKCSYHGSQGLIIALVLGSLVSMVFIGVLSDFYGAKKIMTVSTTCMCITALLTSISHSIYAMIFYRFLHGIAMGCGFSLLFAIFIDLGKDNKSFYVSFLSIAFNVCFCIAPIVGGYVSNAFGWRSVFFLLTGLCTIACIAMCFLPSLPKKGYSLKIVLQAYLSIIKDIRILSHGINPGLFIACTMGFLTFAAHYLRTNLHYDTGSSGAYQGLLALPHVISGIMLIKLIKMYSAHRILCVSLTVALLSGLWILTLGSIDNVSIIAFTVPIFIFCLCDSVCYIVHIDNGISIHKEFSGIASSFLGLMRCCAIVIYLYILGICNNIYGHSLLLQGIFIVITTVICLALYLLTWWSSKK